MDSWKLVFCLVLARLFARTQACRDPRPEPAEDAPQVAGLAHSAAQQLAQGPARARDGGAQPAHQGRGHSRFCSSHAAHDTASNAIQAPLPLQ